MELNEHDITLMLQNIEDPEQSYQKIFPLVYQQLLKIAQNIRFQWQGNLTMNATSLVHEAYIKMIRQDELNIKSRKHFFAIAAQAMKQILINYAQAKSTKKRGDDLVKVDIEDVDLSVNMSEEFSDNLLELCEALERLKVLSERQSQVVHYRFFTGLTLPEIAQLLEVSDRTIKRDWNSAKVWLYQQMNA
jgi:RNA polymerase sigma factor (TIGR02999 family)